MSEAVRAQPVTWEERPYRPGEVAGYRFVVACTDDPAVNEQVFLDGEAAGVFVNAADDPAHCSATLPARLEHGPRAGRGVDRRAQPGAGGLAPGPARRAAGARGRGPRRAALGGPGRAGRRGERRPAADWRAALDSGMLEHLRNGRPAEAREQLQAALDLAGEPAPEKAVRSIPAPCPSSSSD